MADITLTKSESEECFRQIRSYSLGLYIEPTPGKTAPNGGIATAFVVFFDGYYFLVTAGHFIKDLVAVFGEDSSVKFIFLESGIQKRDPFAPELLIKLSDWHPPIDEKVEGHHIDFAVTQLKANFWKILSIRGQKCLDSSFCWDARPLNAISVACGLALEEIRYSGGGVKGTFAMIELEPDHSKSLSHFQFKWSRALTQVKGRRISSPAGMSGSPIFGFFYEKKELKLCLNGIQSRWDKKNIISATPASVLWSFFEEVKKEAEISNASTYL